jgi:2-polyprenyl-6-methoxyphenol hydroxylase-like FAD-dependent oxidoreductase
MREDGSMTEVLVVGAGPVGLTMAAELGRHGARCRIIDRLAAPTGYCKAVGVTPRTLEVWEDMGVVRAMIDAGLWLRGLRMIVTGTPHDTLMDLSALPYGQLGIPQYETERIMSEHLARFGIGVERGVALTSLRDDGRRVAVELAGANGRIESAEFRYVVGCDGAHSAVRHALDIGFPGDRFPMPFMLGDVAIDWDVPRGLAVMSAVPRENAAPDFVVAIPLPGRNRYRLSMLAPPDLATPGIGPEHGIASELPGPTLAELQTVADRLLPGAPRLADLRWSSLFGISMRLADNYRVGNAFIVGDAAHIHPPTGGQGMNTGIQDAYNLAWKMTQVLHGVADARLLDSYEAERRPVGAEVVARTRQASMSFGRERASKEERLADTQILVNYRGSAWVKDATPALKATVRAGDRAPDVQGLRRDQIGFPLRLFDVLRGTAHVLVCCLAAGELRGRVPDLEMLARELHDANGPKARVVAIVTGATGVTDLVGITLLLDYAGAFARAYGATAGYTCLVRPDGYLAYVADRLERGEVLAALAGSLGHLDRTKDGLR